MNWPEVRELYPNQFCKAKNIVISYRKEQRSY